MSILVQKLYYNNSPLAVLPLRRYDKVQDLRRSTPVCGGHDSSLESITGWLYTIRKDPTLEKVAPIISALQHCSGLSINQCPLTAVLTVLYRAPKSRPPLSNLLWPGFAGTLIIRAVNDIFRGAMQKETLTSCAKNLAAGWLQVVKIRRYVGTDFVWCRFNYGSESHLD